MLSSVAEAEAPAFSKALICMELPVAAASCSSVAAERRVKSKSRHAESAPDIRSQFGQQHAPMFQLVDGKRKLACYLLISAILVR